MGAGEPRRARRARVAGGGPWQRAHPRSPYAAGRRRWQAPRSPQRAPRKAAARPHPARTAAPLPQWAAYSRAMSRRCRTTCSSTTSLCSCAWRRRSGAASRPRCSCRSSARPSATARWACLRWCRRRARCCSLQLWTGSGAVSRAGAKAVCGFVGGALPCGGGLAQVWFRGQGTRPFVGGRKRRGRCCALCRLALYMRGFVGAALLVEENRREALVLRMLGGQLLHAHAHALLPC